MFSKCLSILQHEQSFAPTCELAHLESRPIRVNTRFRVQHRLRLLSRVQDDNRLPKEVHINDIAFGSCITVRNAVCSGEYNQTTLTVCASPLSKGVPCVSDRHVEDVAYHWQSSRSRWFARLRQSSVAAICDVCKGYYYSRHNTVVRAEPPEGGAHSGKERKGRDQRVSS